MSISKKQAHDQLLRWVNQITHESAGPLVDDCMLISCKGCGEKAWLKDDITHGTECEVKRIIKLMDVLKP